MILYLVAALGVALGAWNTWQRLGRSSRARAWSRDPSPGTARNVLVRWPLLALACVASALVGLDAGSAATGAGVVVMLGALLVALAYVLLPLPVPEAVKPRWYRDLDLPASRTRD